MNFNPNFRAFGSKSPRSNSSNMPVFKGKPCKKVAAKKKSCEKTTAKQEPLKKKANNRGTKIGAFAKKGKLSKEKSECKKSPKKVKSPAAFEKKAKASEKPKLNAKNLEKLGEMRLKDKIALASEEETVEEAALVLKDLLSPEEKNRLWSKHQTHLKNNATPEEKKEYKEADKVTKGKSNLMWLLKKECPKFLHVTKEVSGEQEASREEKWISEKLMLKQWSKEELESHLQSGRIVARECPTTWGVWEYCDMQAWSKRMSAKTKKKAVLGQESHPDSEEEAQLEEMWSGNLQQQASKLCYMDDGGGKGPGKSSKAFDKKGKGKGGKAKGGNQQLALKDKEKEDEKEEDEEKEKGEEEQLKEAMKKAKRARDVCTSTLADFEDALGKANPYLSKLAKQNSLKEHQLLQAHVTKLKDVLSKENMSLEKLKAFLQEGANKLKDVKDTMKELKGLANKAGSKASSSKAK